MVSGGGKWWQLPVITHIRTRGAPFWVEILQSEGIKPPLLKVLNPLVIFQTWLHFLILLPRGPLLYPPLHTPPGRCNPQLPHTVLQWSKWEVETIPNPGKIFSSTCVNLTLSAWNICEKEQLLFSRSQTVPFTIASRFVDNIMVIPAICYIQSLDLISLLKEIWQSWVLFIRQMWHPSIPLSSKLSICSNWEQHFSTLQLITVQPTCAAEPHLVCKNSVFASCNLTLGLSSYKCHCQQKNCCTHLHLPSRTTEPWLIRQSLDCSQLRAV